MNPLLLVSHSDDWVSGRIRRWSRPRWFETWMVASTRLGDGWAWLAVVIVAPAGGEGHEARVLAQALVAAVAVNALQLALKRAFHRTRPAPATRPVAVAAPDEFSFPSGHAMNAFAVAVLVTVQAPPAAPVAFMVASSVGASRVVLELHYASDVVAGAALGSVLAAGACLLLG